MFKVIVQVLILSFALPALAVLGEKDTSVVRDRQALNASAKAIVRKADLYTVHEITADGTTIKEFASSDGIIFAVSWRGMAAPDLSILFGTYYNDYQFAEKNTDKKANRRMLKIESSRVHVRRMGHMRDVRGLAFVPNLVPAGVDVEQLP